MSASDAGSDYKSQVIQLTDIVALIGHTVALKKRGKDYVGLCPFHGEKTPSFHVSPARQFFYCYGCKAGGNAIDFVMRRDRVEFLDALKQLGQEAGIEMPRFGASKEKASQTQALLDANSAACAFFERRLADPQAGAAARSYLAERGIDAASIQRFQIGVAPDAWDGLLQSPMGRKYRPELLLQAGLAKKRERGDGYYDTFRNRLMFPIRDENARVIALGGRIMPGADPTLPKYLNSPETPLFSKSRSIFGLDLARQKIVESRTAIVVEGYTDVVMAHQFGVANVVSILGTAMTEQHVAKLRRYLPDDGTGRIVLLFDADTAGDLAVDRTVGLFLTQPVEIAIASMPPDVDPDEYLLNEGTEAFEKLIAAAPDALTYKWKQLVRRLDADGQSLTGQQKAVEEYLQVLADARGTGPVDALRWGAALSRVSRLTEVPTDQLNRRFSRSGTKHSFRSAWRGATTQPSDNTGRVSDASPPPRPLNARDRAERRILGALLLEPHRWIAVQKAVAVEDFTDELRKRLAEVYWNHQRDEGEPVFNEFLGALGDSALQELAVAALHDVEELPDLAETLSEAIGYLSAQRTMIEEQKLVATLRRTSEEPLSEHDEVALIRRLQEKARQPDLRRT